MDAYTSYMEAYTSYIDHTNRIWMLTNRIQMSWRGCSKASCSTKAKGASRETERLAAPGALAGTAAVRCDVPVPAITGASSSETVLKM